MNFLTLVLDTPLSVPQKVHKVYVDVILVFKHFRGIIRPEIGLTIVT